MKRYMAIVLGLAFASPAAPSITFQAEPPAAPTSVPLVQVAPVPMTRDTIQRRAEVFGMKSPQNVKSPRGLALQSGTLLLVQDSLGAELFADTNRMMAETPGEAPPLADSAAVKLATSLLKRTPRIDSSEVVVDRVRHMFNQGEDELKGAVTDPTQDESIVVFTRRIGGIAVVPGGGAGEHLSIHLDNKGNLTGQRCQWRNARAVRGSIPILPYSQVRELFVQRLTAELGKLNDAVITRIDFGYYGRPEGQPQGWLQPVYLFWVSLISPEMKQAVGARIIPMFAADTKYLREPLELVLPPLEEGKRENVRFSATAPSVPKSAPCFAISLNTVDEATMRARATHLGLGTGTLLRTPGGLAFTDQRSVVMMDVAGGESFADTRRLLAETPGAVAPQSDDLVLGYAKEYLSKLGDVDTAQLGTPVIRRLYQQAFDIEKKAPGPITIDEAIVEYPRLLLGARGVTYPCVGEGAFLTIHLDNAGKPTGHRRVWRSVGEPLITKELRPYADLEADFLRHLVSELGSSLADVVGIQYGYYFRPPGFQQSFAQPAVLYDVDILDPETKAVTAHRRIPVPAATEILEPLDDPAAALGDGGLDQSDSREEAITPIAYGDLTKDGVVDSMDVALALRIAGGVTALSDPAVLASGDLYPIDFPPGDSQITMGDAMRIVRTIYGLDSIADGP